MGWCFMITYECAVLFCSSLDEYLMHRYKYKTKPGFLAPSFTIDVSRSLVYMYLRLKPNAAFWGNDTLVIANLSFKQMRKGNGESLLRFLVNQATKIGFDNLGIEQVGSMAMLNFVQKFQFQAIDQLDYKISFNKLNSVLNPTN